MDGAAQGLVAPAWQLRLYVAGRSPKSLVAMENLRRLCEVHLQGRVEIEVIDLLVAPRQAKADQVFAIPTLVRRSPHPQRRVLGDLSDTARVLAGLELPVGQAATAT